MACGSRGAASSPGPHRGEGDRAGAQPPRPSPAPSPALPVARPPAPPFPGTFPSRRPLQ